MPGERLPVEPGQGRDAAREHGGSEPSNGREPSSNGSESEDEVLERALDSLGFKRVSRFEKPPLRPPYARAGGIMIVAARGGRLSPADITAIRRMSEPGASIFEHQNGAAADSGDDESDDLLSGLEE